MVRPITENLSDSMSAVCRLS